MTTSGAQLENKAIRGQSKDIWQNVIDPNSFPLKCHKCYQNLFLLANFLFKILCSPFPQCIGGTGHCTGGSIPGSLMMPTLVTLCGRTDWFCNLLSSNSYNLSAVRNHWFELCIACLWIRWKISYTIFYVRYEGWCKWCIPVNQDILHHCIHSGVTFIHL